MTRRMVALIGLALAGCTTANGSSPRSAGAGTDSGAVAPPISAADSAPLDSGATAPGGRCAPGCVSAADCCPQGIQGCPGEYPNAWTCEGGVCHAGGCANDDECRPGGDFARFSCHAVSGVGGCFEPCTGDPECAAIPDATCSGEADDGARFCKASTRCIDDASCAGYGRCDVRSGECRCATDAQCAALPGLVCAK